ncbi:MAG: M23 family metallopeptidase [Microthrixaceae bacterium]
MPSISRGATRRLAAALSVSAVLVTSACLDNAQPPATTGLEEIAVFPLAIPISFTDTHGAPRSGGRSHQGQDLMASKGTVAIAVVDGTITQIKHSNDGLAGNQLRLTGDNGWTYYYIHLNNDTPGTDDGANRYDQAFVDGIRVGQRVRAGEPVGFVGDSGNAESTAPHLHFEAHHPTLGVVNSYSYLKAAPVWMRDTSSTRTFGSLDSVSSTAANTISVAGWALAPGTDDAAGYSVYLNGNPAYNAKASTPRPDVAAVYPTYGPNHGFAATIPGVVSGQHEVCVVLHNPGPGGGSRTGCATVTVA